MTGNVAIKLPTKASIKDAAMLAPILSTNRNKECKIALSSFIKLRYTSIFEWIVQRPNSPDQNQKPDKLGKTLKLWLQYTLLIKEALVLVRWSALLEHYFLELWFEPVFPELPPFSVLGFLGCCCCCGFCGACCFSCRFCIAQLWFCLVIFIAITIPPFF